MLLLVAVLFDVVFCRFRRMVGGMHVVAMRQMRIGLPSHDLPPRDAWRLRGDVLLRARDGPRRDDGVHWLVLAWIEVPFWGTRPAARSLASRI